MTPQLQTEAAQQTNYLSCTMCVELLLLCLWTNLKTFSDSFLSTCGGDPKRMRQTELCVQLNCIKTTLGPHKMLSNIFTFHILLFAFNIKYSVDTKVLTVLQYWGFISNVSSFKCALKNPKRTFLLFLSHYTRSLDGTKVAFTSKI